jgi:hypothetical protein
MMREKTPYEEPHFYKKKASWVALGLHTACDCFTCANKIRHESKGFYVQVLCGDPCHYKGADSKKI